ncbi:MAG TPA: non-ribosomal peptide synthetase [Actinocrinis sp.]|nr:non-ribosomal peptide synthetase [Actinocrinis sp.]
MSADAQTSGGTGTADADYGIDDASPGCPVVRAFERVVDAAPDSPAVLVADREVSFAELDALANAVALRLLDQPGGPDSPVALLVEDPVLMIAAQLGTLKAARPYAVVNPGFPAAQQHKLLTGLHAGQVLTDQKSVPAVDATVLTLSGLQPTTQRPTSTVAVTAGDLAYVLFTSGSTGEPKGVAQNRADMMQNVLRHAPLGIGPADRVTLISSDGVISAVSNLYIGLLNGAAVAPYSYRRDGVHEMVDWIGELGVTVFYAFPSFLRQAVAAAPGASANSVRLTYLGGEPVLPSDFAALARLFPNAVRATGLNSTETGLTRLFQLPSGEPAPNPVPLGGPVAGVDTVLGEDGRIVIRSAHVRPLLWTPDGPVALTKPADGDETEPAVHELTTGDRGAIDPAGHLVHLGRADMMIKVRGFRVEPTEVEAALTGIPGVAEAGVLAYGDTPEQTELAAVVTVTDPALDPAAIRGHVRDLLPPGMVPTRVVVCRELPRTANGKLNRRELASLVAAQAVAEASAGAVATLVAEPTVIESAAPAAAPAAAATSDTYDRLLAIWRTVLRTTEIGAEEDFFVLGGTSISALSVISRVRKEFGVPVRLAVLFETPTLAALAEAVDASKAAAASA